MAEPAARGGHRAPTISLPPHPAPFGFAQGKLSPTGGEGLWRKISQGGDMQGRVDTSPASPLMIPSPYPFINRKRGRGRPENKGRPRGFLRRPFIFSRLASGQSILPGEADASLINRPVIQCRPNRRGAPHCPVIHPRKRRLTCTTFVTIYCALRCPAIHPRQTAPRKMPRFTG